MTAAFPNAPAPPPGPGGPPPCLDLDADGEDARAPLPELLARAQCLGPVSALRVGGQLMVLVTGPDEVEHVLVRHPEVYGKHSHRARALLGEGLISATGDAWRGQRRLLQPHFTTAGVRRYERHIEDAAARAAHRWAARADDGRGTDVGEDMGFFALDTIWRLLTARPLDDATHADLAALGTVVAALPATGPAVTQPEAVEEALASIDATAHRVIDAARADRAARAGQEPEGILDVLLDAARTRPEYTDRLIRDELVTLVVAGHETSATTLAWLWLLLHRHPEAREWALAAGEPGSPGRRQAVQALISETLRLYPAVWLVPRHTTAADTLGGYRVEAGTRVLVCPYLVHRDPARWPEPDAFDPRRFIRARGARHGAYHPFGVGARACLGQQFALREMTALLDALLPGYVPGFHQPPAAPVFGANLRPDGPMAATIRRAGPA
ncbi:cytochrome P450 [Streptomyces sp. B1866]|uniref:cytochrome P450 n=1 Tax=Streptomyces sp. B1866 TaxID=3075431 RepID=UPI002891AF4D|nr:cytochrome P450 [Streptomyces sp. B1866]MDT3398247.1 cytochrome P450 [Streptomyces sp. B1866]